MNSALSNLNMKVKDQIEILMDDSVPLEEKKKVFGELEPLEPSDVVPALTSLLAELELELVHPAEELLKKLGAKELLVQQLEEGCGEERIEAARLLANLADPGAASALIGVLADPDPMLREQAAGALVELRVPEAENALRERLTQDDSPDVRAAAAQALGEIGRDAEETLVNAVKSEQDSCTRAIIELSLERLRSKGAE